MSTRTIVERTIPARDLPRYVGWQANGIMRNDGRFAWGPILEATDHESPSPYYPGEVIRSVNLVINRTVQNPGHGVTTVPDGALVPLVNPSGENMVTVSHGAEVETAGDEHPATCRLCYPVAVIMPDAFPGYVFPCESIDPVRWNGWACPNFTREQGMALVAASLDPECEGDPVTYDAERDLFIVTSEGYPDEPDEYGPMANGLYPIGSWAWCWENAR